MNPLDLRVPELLLFYLVYGVGGFSLACFLRWLWSRGKGLTGERRWNPGYSPRNDEAYGIALLRGGRKEAVRTLLGRLVVTGAVIADRGEIRKAPMDGLYLSPLERSVLDSLDASETPGGAEKLAAQVMAPTLAGFETDLERQGLVPTTTVRQKLTALRALTLVAVPGLGVAKLVVALSRGETKVGFLLVFLAAYTAATWFLLRPPRHTAAGRRYLEWLRTSHWGLKNLVDNGGREDAGEATLVAAIFGIAVVPTLADLRLALEPPKLDREDSEDFAFFPDFGGGDGGGSSYGGGSCGGG